MKRAKSVDEYIENSPHWQSELNKLREILTSTALTEEIKWGAPCYTHGGKNIVGIAAFKDYFGLWFHQGVFLSDPAGVLINAQEGKTKALRQWRFTSGKDIKVRQIKSYVSEAIGLQEQGKELKPERNKKFDVPAELDQALAGNRQAKAAFAQLTPGRQREYATYVAEAKREATRVGRTEKVIPMILAGVGLHDKYRNC